MIHNITQRFIHSFDQRSKISRDFRPSRITVMIGKTFICFKRRMNSIMDWNWKGISKNDVTLPRVLHDAGYKTIHVGKAHFGCQNSDGELPQNIGFDVNIAGSSIGHPGSYYGENGYGHIKGQKARAVPGLEKYHGTDTFLSEALTLEANEQITEAVGEKKPFFLVVLCRVEFWPVMIDAREGELTLCA